MNYRKYSSHPAAVADSNRLVSISPPSGAKVRKPSDPVLGTVAVGAMLLLLGWVVTGIDLLAILALLIALAYVRVAGALKSSESWTAAKANFVWRKPEATPHPLAIDARFHGLAAVRANDARDGDPSRSHRRDGASARPRRRSAYDGLAD